MSRIFSAAVVVVLLVSWLPRPLSAQDPPPPRAETDEVPSAAADEPDEIRFRLTGLRSDEGRVVCTLFTEDGWLRQPEQSAVATIENGSALCLLPNPQKGARGLSAYHDEDLDGELDSGFMRIPKEGTCASNNAFRKFGPPRFRDAKFEYQGGALELEAEIRYLSKKK